MKIQTRRVMQPANTTSRKAGALMVLALAVAAAPTAFAQLERVGPVDRANGYPAWYQDKTGLSMEFCQVQNQAELDGGWCLLLPGNTTAPELFPTAFSDEHFYWSANASGTLATGGKALLVLALEGAFANGPVAQGDQIVFGRVRVKMTQLPQTGTYTVLHPYGTEKIDGVAGTVLFFTRDIGLNCAPGQFDCALLSDIGPFLLPSNTPGGAELLPISGPVPGKLYIADPARLGPVTGSKVNQNFFRVIAPDGSILVDTPDFGLSGRLFTGSIPGRVTVDRTTYVNSATARQVDVFATATPTVPGRLPGGAALSGVTPVLSFFNAGCVEDPATGVKSAPLTSPQGKLVQTAMIGSGSAFWGQLQPGTQGLPGVPDQVCVKDDTAQDALGRTAPAFFNAAVVDEVVVTGAQYNAGTHTLTISAASSDTVTPTTLKSNVYGQIMTLPVSLAGALPPSMVNVTSSNGGRAQMMVKIIGGTGTGGVAIAPANQPPVANNDSVTTTANTPTTIRVLANDTDPNGPADLVPSSVRVITAVQTPLGATASAIANPDGTILFTGNGPGTYSFQYSVSDAAGATASATVTVTINPVITGPETITAGTALFRNDQKRWVVSGTDSVIAGQKITIAYANGTLQNGTAIAGTAQAVLGSTVVDALGGWLFDARGVTGLLDPTSTLFSARPTLLKITSALGGSITVAFTLK